MCILQKVKKNHQILRVFLGYLLLRPQRLMREQVLSLPGFLSLNRRLDNVCKTPLRLSTTVHTPEPMLIPTNYQQQARLRLLAEVSTTQFNPFEALATHQTVTYDDEAATTGIAGAPNLPSDPYQAEQSPDPTDTNKWIIVDKSQARPYICGFPECDEDYKYKSHLVRHFIVHIGKSKYKCLHPECVGKEYFGDSTLLKRHIAIKHTRDKPFQCELCAKRFKLKHHLKYHMRRVHDIEEEKNSPKRKRK